MDNNVNQYDAQNNYYNNQNSYTGYVPPYNTNNVSYNQDSSQNYTQPQFDVATASGIGGYESEPRYHVLTVPEKPNIVMGTIGALIVATLGTLLWILIEAFTGYIIFYLAIGILYVSTIAYGKLAKGIDTVGVIICSVLMCIAIYLGNRYGQIGLIANEGECSMNIATTLHDYWCETDSSYNFEYIVNMALSYVCVGIYSGAMIFKK